MNRTQKKDLLYYMRIDATKKIDELKEMISTEERLLKNKTDDKAKEIWNKLNEEADKLLKKAGLVLESGNIFITNYRTLYDPKTTKLIPKEYYAGWVYFSPKIDGLRKKIVEIEKFMDTKERELMLSEIDAQDFMKKFTEELAKLFVA